MKQSEENSFTLPSMEESIGFLLWQVTTIWQQKIKKVLDAKYKITHTQFVILASIHFLELNEGEVTQILLSHHTKIEPMNVSQVLKSLEIRNLVTRRTHSTDPRARAVNLTDEGRELARKAVVSVENLDKVFFDKLGESNRIGFVQALANLKNENIA